MANGTFRRLHSGDTIHGPSGQRIPLPQHCAVNIQNWARHRNCQLWGDDADSFNPDRPFKEDELARVGCPMAAMNPSSSRFSPFAHSPRSCLGRNFAQMEMRLIMLYLLRDFNFCLGTAYNKLASRKIGVASSTGEFRGVNRATMGPMNLEDATSHVWGTRPLQAMKMTPQLRSRAKSLVSRL